MTGGSEYRINRLPDGKRLIRWRNQDCSAVWLHVAVVDRLEDVSDELVDHRDGETPR